MIILVQTKIHFWACLKNKQSGYKGVIFVVLGKKSASPDFFPFLFCAGLVKMCS
jgi:hypothetical protein